MAQVVMLVSMAADNWSLMPGNVTEVSDEVANEWVLNGIAKLSEPPEVKVIERPDPIVADTTEAPIELNELPPEGIRHVGGGWYLLPNGDKVQGKDEALDELKILQGSDE